MHWSYKGHRQLQYRPGRALLHLRRTHDYRGDPPLPEGREPSIEEIAKLLELKREDVVFALDAILDPVSLYEPVYSDGGDTICVMDQVKDSKNTDESWLEHIALKEAMNRLSDRERHILNLRFFEGKTQMEVSAEVGISQAQVSRLEKSAINQIKKNL